ncbi:MAG: AEC family transporter [Gammaproteobacteria bacterium]|nr:AEC family transporter [Gammaproteobacteria bacterium]
MAEFAAALAPILLLILIGYGLKHFNFLPAETWPGMEKLTYFLLFPALLIRSLGNQSLAGSPWASMLTVIAITLVIVALLLGLWFRFSQTVSPATFTSIFQGGTRFNTYISLAVCLAFFGPEGLALGSIAAGFMIVLVNLFCISVFALWGDSSSKGIKPFLREVLYNPLIIACAIGWFLSLSGIGLNAMADNILEIIGRAALPFGLLAVGAALRPRQLGGHLQSIRISSLLQFGVKPLLAASLISLTGLSGVAAGALLITFMVPTASSAYILARQLGGDTETMASIITFQTLLAFLLMPLIAQLLLL